jgi:hypothetical protein
MSILRPTSTPHYTPRRLCVFSLYLLLTVVPACARVSAKDYFPLADGSKWEYTGRFSSASGREFNVRATARINGETLIEGNKYFKLVVTTDLSGVPDVGRQLEEVRYYRYAEGGLYFRPGSDPDSKDRLELPSTVSAGVKWLSGTTEVRAENAGTVQAEGRQYKNCLKVIIKSVGSARSVENYYAPGVGVVKTVYVNTTEPRSVVELTLVKYEP